jgi:NAD(P)-dependent dehydrogenase (short-subunit alcohol dehydrogenase family)
MTRSHDKEQKRIALVTGASSGIGRACAVEMARAGFTVFGTSRHPRHAPGSEMFRMIGLDVRDDNSVAKCVQRVLSNTGRIDVLVNNAGVATVGALEETTIDEFKNVIDTNLTGAVRVIKAVLPAMRRQRSGRIVNIGSVVAFIPFPYSAAYCASKHALRGLSESVDYEVRSFGIRIVVVEPGFIRTGIFPHSPVPHGIQEYEGARAGPAQFVREHIENGSDPSVVARVVVEAATAAHPESRYLPDYFAQMMNVARTVLPSAVYDFAFRTYAGLH